MACQYIDIERLRICKPVDDIMRRDVDELQPFYDDIDSMTIAICRDRELQMDYPVPVDETTGFVESEVLHRAMTYYGIYSICNGYNGEGSGDLDDVYKVYVKWEARYLKELDGVTKETILGGADEDDIPSETDQVQSKWYTVL
ncbi:MAG: hypothetical protein GY774_00325 [Planctomycetes bacterium]|nr:hypothetical protein [Planctomycetota bacterium]